MLDTNNFTLFKTKLIYFFVSIFILSFFFVNYFKFEFKFLRFSIVEIIFLGLIILTFIMHGSKFINFIFKFENKNIFEIIICSILILKIVKYFLNFQDYYNLYELIIWIYMITIYILFRFYLTNYKKLIHYIENSFIVVSLMISFHLIYLFLLYKLGYDSKDLWTIRDTTYYPYIGTSSVNFKGIFMNYNQPAHLIAPGFLFLLNRCKYNLFTITLIIFYFVILYLIKSKFLIVFFGILIIYFFLTKFKFQKPELFKVIFFRVFYF